VTYRVEISRAAEKQLKNLSAPVRQVIEKRISWLAEYADASLHHQLKGCPMTLGAFVVFGAPITGFFIGLIRKKKFCASIK
jgi:hypothetical protein